MFPLSKLYVPHHLSQSVPPLYIYPSLSLSQAISVHYYIYQPLRSGRIWHKVNSKWSLTGLNSEFSYTSCLTKAEEPSMPYYLPIAGGRIIGFIPFPRVLVLCEMQSVSSRIWTCVAVSCRQDLNLCPISITPLHYRHLHLSPLWSPPYFFLCFLPSMLTTLSLSLSHTLPQFVLCFQCLSTFLLTWSFISLCLSISVCSFLLVYLSLYLYFYLSLSILVCSPLSVAI